MMEGNKDIFLAGVDALGYLGWPMHKKYSMTFIWDHAFGTCGSYDRSFDPSYVLPCAHMYAFRVLQPFAYVISSIWYPPLPFWICWLAMVSSYCFTSEIRKFMTHLQPISCFFLFQTRTTSWHLIQIPIAYLEMPFH